MKSILLIGLVFSITFLAACDVIEGATENTQSKQAFETYTAGRYSLFECDDTIIGTMDISSDYFRFTETVCDVEFKGVSTDPTGPLVALTNCRSDGGDEADKLVVFEPTNEGVSLHNYGENVFELKRCPKID